MTGLQQSSPGGVQGGGTDSELDALISRIQGLGAAAGGNSAAVIPPSGQGTHAPSQASPSPHPAVASHPESRTSGEPPHGSRPVAPSAEVAPAESAGFRRPPGNHSLAAKLAPSNAPILSGVSSNKALDMEFERLPMAVGFMPSREEPWRPAAPDSAEEAGVTETLLESLVVRYISSKGEAEGRRISDQLKLPFRIVEPMLNQLKGDHRVAYKSATATNDYVYTLTETGRGLAASRNAECPYHGACPVQLGEYISSVKMQSIEGQAPRREDLKRAFSDLLINPRMLDRLGPAVASGRGMFLFGYPGNGKTSIAERVTGAFGKYVWVPRAIEIEGEIMRVFDPMNHELDMPESSSGILDVGGFDKRWVRIKRPTIVAGGELTMDMLEVSSGLEASISEAPLQLKSNCGTLVIDDFGRQKMSVDSLLNRWIIPLEKRYDFLNMAGGKKIQVPFDQLVVFSTNLEPRDLVDDAFLRRIPYKIEAEDPPEQDFRKLFEIMCKALKIPHSVEAVDYLIRVHYKSVDRPMRMCQPRDLLLQVKNFCLYNDRPIELRQEYLDFACENYFSVM